MKFLDITAALAAIAEADPAFFQFKDFALPPQREKLVLDKAGVLRLGDLLAESLLRHP